MLVELVLSSMPVVTVAASAAAATFSASAAVVVFSVEGAVWVKLFEVLYESTCLFRVGSPFVF